MNGNEIKPDQWRIFFDSLDNAESVSTACRNSKIPRSTAYWHQKNTRWVKERWEEALANGVDYLKDAATERAVIGVTSTHHSYFKGEIVATHIETKYSDRLLLALIAARDPAFRNNSSDQVQQRLTQELTKMLDLLQRKLSPDVYAQVIDVLATGDDIIDVNPIISAETPRYLEGDESI